MKKLTVLTIIITSVFMIAPLFGQVYPEGMVSYWKFDEGSGTTATDSAGTNDGTIYGPEWTTGIVHGALSFDGSDDYIYVSDSASLASPSSTQELSIEAWLYAESLNYNIDGIVIKRPGINPWQMEYQFLIFNERLTFAATMGGWYREYLSTGADLGNELNRWIHVVLVYDHGALKFYLDGEQDGDLITVPYALVRYPGSELRIGIEPWNNWYFNGLIDEVAVYNRALIPDEIQQHYQNGLNGSGYEEYITVDIDIKPGSCPNPLNVKSKGMLPVAILGAEDFDVNTVDVASIRLVDVAPIRSSYEDVATPVPDNGEICECTTEGPDGYLDLTLKFDIQDIVAELGEVNDGDEFELTLTGELYTGTAIEGKDCIVIISKSKPK